MIARLRPHADLLLAGALAVILATEILTSDAVSHRGLTLVLLVPTALALAVRRTRPLVPMLALFAGYTASGFAATDIEELQTTLAVALVASYAIGRYARVPWPGAVLGAATVTLSNLGAANPSADDWVFPFCVVGAAMLTGRALRTRARVAAELAERTERLSVEQDLRAAEAALDERRRVARELHDVVAHTLSVMVVQAGAARVTLGRDVERSIEALETVEATGREALGELRRLLGFVADPAEPAALAPQPTLEGLDGLARRAGAAGLPTRLVIDGDPDAARPLPAGAAVAAYRIAQEALTNALKHAGPGATALLVVRWQPDALEIEVVDDGGARSEGAGAALPGGGHGLVGMRERVALFGGQLDAGPRPEGGFRVRARFPRAASVAVPV